MDNPKPLFVSFVRLRGGMSAGQAAQDAALHVYDLQMKTTRTLGDRIQKESAVFFLETFRLVSDSA